MESRLNEITNEAHEGAAGENPDQNNNEQADGDVEAAKDNESDSDWSDYGSGDDLEEEDAVLSLEDACADLEFDFD